MKDRCIGLNASNLPPTKLSSPSSLLNILFGDIGDNPPDSFADPDGALSGGSPDLMTVMT